MSRRGGAEPRAVKLRLPARLEMPDRGKENKQRKTNWPPIPPLLTLPLSPPSMRGALRSLFSHSEASLPAFSTSVTGRPAVCCCEEVQDRLAAPFVCEQLRYLGAVSGADRRVLSGLF